MIAMASKSAGHGRQELTKYIYENYDDSLITLVYTSWASPFNPWHGMPAKFYVEDRIFERRIHSLCELKEESLDKGKVNLLVLSKGQLQNPDCVEILSRFPHKKLIQSVPSWIEKLNEYYGELNPGEVLVLYEFTATD